MAPHRMCIACRAEKERSDLIRLVKAYETKKVHVQPTSKIFGRSAYICYNKDCLSTSLKKARIQKALRQTVCEDILKMLQNMAK